MIELPPPKTIGEWAAIVAIVTSPIGVAYLCGLMMENARDQQQGRGR